MNQLLQLFWCRNITNHLSCAEVTYFSRVEMVFYRWITRLSHFGIGNWIRCSKVKSQREYLSWFPRIKRIIKYYSPLFTHPFITKYWLRACFLHSLPSLILHVDSDPEEPLICLWWKCILSVSFCVKINAFEYIEHFEKDIMPFQMNIIII